VSKAWIVSIITALLMIVFGVFWMFMWLVGTNGYSSSTGGMILTVNFVLVLLSVVAASVASGLLAKMLKTKMGWSLWLAGPLSIAVTTVVAAGVMFVLSIIIVIAVGDRR
jgi:hypothetical protein